MSQKEYRDLSINLVLMSGTQSTNSNEDYLVHVQVLEYQVYFGTWFVSIVGRLTHLGVVVHLVHLMLALQVVACFAIPSV